ncbi:DUF664 domain-containing protein [Psychromicrobium sp. YIM B11713]|uniref:mycothiol transferase n=1 Tax=Psychromicrobium sp. YIM B11713 TaxID=3145233 RepID=UPI00374FB701
METIRFIEPPLSGTEAEVLIGVLERTRSVFAWKCQGISSTGLNSTLGSSRVTLGGLLKHLAWVEEQNFGWKLSGRRPSPPWDSVDWRANPDWEWTSAAENYPEELKKLWSEAVERSRTALAGALLTGDLGQPVHIADEDGNHANLRRIIVDQIDEYARHNGHADLLRESIDGSVGEDPPTGFSW